MRSLDIPLQKTILIVDDNIINLKVAISTLEAYSYEILTARTGEAGLARALRAKPDLILLDVQMPGIDGFEVCRRLKANPVTAAIPVIFMTVRSDTTDVVTGLEVGAVDFVTKPIHAEELLARVRTHLTLHHLQARLADEVMERTTELTAEIEQRKHQQAENERLLATLHAQSEQLRNFTRLFLTGQQAQQAGLEQIVDAEFKRKLGLLTSHLDIIRQLITTAKTDTQSIDTRLVQTVLNRIDLAIDTIEELHQQAKQVHDGLHSVATEQQALLDNPLLELSTREREVLRMLVDGKSNGEIAETLTLARGTVSTYRRRIMDKLGVNDLPSLIRFALQNNLGA